MSAFIAPEAELSSTIDWLAEAERIGQSICRHSQHIKNGSIGWLKPSRPMDKDGKPLYLGPHLHMGYTGIALFLAALGHTAKKAEYSDLALRAVAPLRRYLQHLIENPDVAARYSFRLGALVGLGSFVYSFSRLALWLNEPSLYEDACNAALLITPEQIAADKSNDLMYGGAGAILGLLVFEQEAPRTLRQKASSLKRAVACGEHLLTVREADPGQPGGWSTDLLPPCAGFAHGASGVSYALAKLAQRTGREDFWQAALGGLAFEQQLYTSEHRNWRIVPSGKTIMAAWCNGAAGIALSRVSLPLGKDHSQIRQDLDIALTTTASHIPKKEEELDDVCCGNLGRAEILFQASKKLVREDLLQRAYEIASKVVNDAAGSERPHGYRCSIEKFSPGFFKGMAGIGYTLLRLSETAELPCVLAME